MTQVKFHRFAKGNEMGTYGDMLYYTDDGYTIERGHTTRTCDGYLHLRGPGITTAQNGVATVEDSNLGYLKEKIEHFRIVATPEQIEQHQEHVKDELEDIKENA